MNDSDTEIYKYYLGQELDVDKFIQNLDRDRYHKQLYHYWSKFLDIPKESNLLDLGCGWGDLLTFFQNQGFKNLYGIDASPQQVEIANKLGLGNVICGDLFQYIDKLNFENKKFHIISAFNLLEHIDKDQILPFLKKLNNLLYDGGKLLLEIPDANSNFGSRTRYWDFTHKTSFTPTSIRQVLRVASFKEVTIQEKIAVPKNILGRIRIILWKLIKLKIYFALLVEKGSIGEDIFSQDMHVISIKVSVVKL